MSIVPMTVRAGPARLPLRADVTSWSISSLTLSPSAPARPFSQVTLSDSSVTEIARRAI